MRGRKWLSCIPLVLFPAAIAFTFDRNLWIGVVIASIASILIVRTEGGRVVLLVLVLVIGAVLLGTLLDAYFPRIGITLDALSLRFQSLFAGDDLVYDSSTQWRLLENKYAIPTIQKHPLLGIGPRATYRPPIRLGEDLLRHYVHNAYLWLLVDFGFAGFLPFLWFSMAFLLRGISAWYTLDDPILRSLALGFTAGYIVLLVSSLAAPRFLTTYGAILVGAVLGINEVIIRLGRQARQ
jgi:O-antigen ligase